MVSLAPFTTDDWFRVLGPAPPRCDDLATYYEPTDLDDFLVEAGELDRLIRLVEVLGRQLHAPSSALFRRRVNSGCERPSDGCRYTGKERCPRIEMVLVRLRMASWRYRERQSWARSEHGSR
jgi:hypothetical protein